MSFEQVIMLSGAIATWVTIAIQVCAATNFLKKHKHLSLFIQHGIALMKYLCTMITPENGVILDPFMGSGSTGVAAIAQGFQFIGIEQEEDYLKIARARVAHAAMEVQS